MWSGIGKEWMDFWSTLSVVLLAVISIIISYIFSENHSSKTSTTETSTHKKTGPEKKITEPESGEEVMRQLLACKGKDPYSILGLKNSASDEDIRKQYRRKAILVHPDKNQRPGAEEAFKILGNAFDQIGEASKRLTYDRKLREEEAARREFNDFITKLEEKIKQERNLMRCDNCGGTHKRVPIDRPWFKARYCYQCSTHHPAFEGDLWAETSTFQRHYYAFMEDSIFEVTEWVTCKEHLQHLPTNAHYVFCHIIIEGNTGQHGRSTGSHPTSFAGAGGDLDDFINNLYRHVGKMDGGASGSPFSQNSFGSSSRTSAQRKRHRRRKNRHR